MGSCFHKAARFTLSGIAAAFFMQQAAFGENQGADSLCAEPDQGVARIVSPFPDYPAGAAYFCIEGFLVVELEVQPDGSVWDPRIVESEPPYVFDEGAAIVESWRYRPKCENGEPVAHRTKLRIDFEFEPGGDRKCPENLRGEALAAYTSAISLFSKHRLDAMNRPDRFAPLELLPVEPTLSGEWGEVEAYLIRHWNRSIALNNYMLARIREIGWDRIRDPHRLAADDGMAESRRILEDMHRMYVELNEKARQAMADAREELNILHLGPEAREFLGDGDRVSEHDWSDYEAVPQFMWDLLAENAAIIDLLEQTSGRWMVENDAIRFLEQRDLDEFTVHVHAIDEMVEHGKLLELELFDQFWGKLESR